MRLYCTFAAIFVALTLAVGQAGSQEVVDRIVAKVESDIILMSDVQQLARDQLFLDGKSQSDSEILDRLIDQWIVRNEAKVARFPQPSEEDVNRSIERLKRPFRLPKNMKRARRKAA